ncbi:MAG: hypothetical protein P8Q16_00325 [Flavobacteriales bacterium]|nr:hypothetical protein [Flavobacteriales bacterium]
MKNIFQSITIIKKEIFEDITKMHDTLISILKILKANPPSNL